MLPVSVCGHLWGGEGVCVRGVGLGVMSHRRLPSGRVSWRASRGRLRTYGWSWGVGRLRGWTPWGFPCGLWHPPPRRLEAAVLRRPLSQPPELRVGPALPPLSLGGAVALGGGVGVAGCDGVVGTGGGGGPGGFLVVLCRGGAWGVGARADVDSWVRAHGLRIRIGLGLAVAAVPGHLLYVG